MPRLFSSLSFPCGQSSKTVHGSSASGTAEDRVACRWRRMDRDFRNSSRPHARTHTPSENKPAQLVRGIVLVVVRTSTRATIGVGFKARCRRGLQTPRLRAALGWRRASRMVLSYSDLTGLSVIDGRSTSTRLTRFREGHSLLAHEQG